ncbi:MAG: T9SS type A sorting domain-containing protein [candidate division Zixibacteria bacterium]|mgnify:CR=1 FL=1|nr:T9SS type A sorting domain-containing protein [candidate division Zixibacteria bacterium]
MDIRSNFLQKKILALFVLVLLPILVNADSPVEPLPEWESITSFRDIRRLTLIGNSLYAATSGGLLVIDGTTYAQYTNVDGLGTTNLFDVIVDSSGQRWIAGAGRIVRLGIYRPQQYLFRDANNDPFDALVLADDGDYLWVGTSIGLVLFSKVDDGGQIQDSYDLFGMLNPGSAVNDVVIAGDSIWIATSSGLAVADKSIPALLNAPSRWETFSLADFPILGSDTIRRVEYFENNIYVATSRGFFRLDRSLADTSFFEFPLTQNLSVTDVKREGNVLIVYYSGGVARLSGGSFTQLISPATPSAPRTGQRVQGYQWLALTGGGLYNNAGGPFIEYPNTGLSQNDVMDVSVSTISRQPTVLFRRGGAATRVGDSWLIHNFNVGDRALAILTDSMGESFVGTFGSGLVRIKHDEANTVIRYDSTNTTLRGNDEGNNYIVIFDLATDGSVLFTPNYRAFTDYPVALLELSTIDNLSPHWDSLGFGDGITDDKVITLAFHNGFFALGTEASGVFLCALGASPFDKSDDNCNVLNQANSNLRSDVVRVVRFAPNGELWVGTNFGLSRIEPTIENRFIDVSLPAGFGPDIVDLEFDTRGNLWLASATGLALFDAVTGDFSTFTTENSDLIDDNCRKVTIDPRSNDLYVSTPLGVSLRRANFGLLTGDVENILAIPNPYIISSNTETLRFNFSASGTLSIFSLAGETIYHSSSLTWNGLNTSGNAVASGVYFFTITDGEGKVGRGKFLLVNKK